MRILLWFTVVVAVAVADVEVMLEGLGKLRGKTGEARNNQKYYQFLGIPFAEPPTKERR